jgi:hypothetical protein
VQTVLRNLALRKTARCRLVRDGRSKNVHIAVTELKSDAVEIGTILAFNSPGKEFLVMKNDLVSGLPFGTATTVASDDDLFNAGLTAAALVGLGLMIIRPRLLPGLVLGVAAMMAPRVFPGLQGSLRPLMKDVIRTGYMAAEKAKEIVAEAGEQLQDLAAEVRYEDAMTKAHNDHSAK